MTNVGASNTMATSKPALQLTDIHMRRRGISIIDQISFTLERDQRWVVLGPNGSGKTTLLRIMALYEHPTSGRVEVLGERLGRTDVRELRQRIGYSSAALADQFRSEISAHDVVRTARYAALEPWWHRYTTTDDDRALQCLAQFDVESFASRPFGSLSSGEQQRVLLARTWMNDPGLVILDEPSARLDLGGREELATSLSRIATDPQSVPLVIVTHHLDEIPVGTTHALLLSRGRTLVSGPVSDVLSSENLSECFGLGLDVERHQNGRFSAWARQ